MESASRYSTIFYTFHQIYNTSTNLNAPVRVLGKKDSVKNFVSMAHPQFKEVKLHLEVTLYLAWLVHIYGFPKEHHFYKI